MTEAGLTEPGLTTAGPAPGSAGPAFVLSWVDAAPQPGHLLHPGGLLSGQGWAIGQEPIASIAVHLGERFLCYASYGQPRPEIGRRFANYPQSDHCGFSFSVRLPETYGAERGADLVFRFQTLNGTETRRVVSLAWPALAEASGGGGPARPWPIRLALEDCRIDETGLLRLRGWAVARTPLTQLELFLGETALATPDWRLERPDIARLYPGYPDAAQSGFSLIQQVALPDDPAARVIRVVARGPKLQRQIIVPLAGIEGQKVLVDGADVSLCCDTLRIAADGALAVAGWVVGQAQTREIELFAETISLGLADIGLPRPDIGNRFPTRPAARWSGFRFSRHGVVEPGALLELAIRDTEGGERRLQLRVPGAAGDHLHATDIVHSGVDTPALSQGRAEAPIRGMLTVAGWAVCASGVARVTIWLDDRAMGQAQLGLRREDIGDLYPELAGALLSGFSVTLPHRLVGDGAHSVRVVVEAASGLIQEHAFDLVCETADDRAVGHIREHVPHVETRLRLALLDRFGPPAETLVVIRKPGGDLRGLAASLASLGWQTSPHWRALVLLPDLAELKPIAAMVEADADLRGRVEICTAEAPPASWWHAEGLLCLLRAGDVLGADALLALALEHRLGAADFVYADERCFDPARNAIRPWFKPDFAPELLLSLNYIGRPWVASRALVDLAGVDLASIETLGDYDAVLRLTERAERVAHVPLVLCERGPRRLESARREQSALQRTAGRRGWEAEVLPGLAPEHWRLRRIPPNAALLSPPVVSIVIPTRGAGKLIERAIASIRAHAPAGVTLEIICLDDIPAPRKRLKQWLRRASDRVIAMKGPFNWSAWNNIGAAAARGDYLLFLNDDIEVNDPDWLPALLEHAQRPEVAVVGPQLLYGDGKVQHAGMFLAGPHGRHAFRYAPADEPGAFGLARTQREVMAVTGACMLMRQTVFAALGGFDERHTIIKNDLDFCLRAQAAGLRVIYTPYATLTHHEMASRARLPDNFDAPHFDTLWGLRQLRGDPWFNPNLSREFDEYLPEPEPAEWLQPGQPRLDPSRIRRILVVKLDHIGDFLTALPALRRLRQHFPAAAITVLGAAATRELIELGPEIDDFEQFDFFSARSIAGKRQFAETELQALRERLAARRFDIAVDLRMHGDTRYVLRYTGAAVLAGFDAGGRFPWLDVVVEWEGDQRLLPKRAHVADRLLQLVDMLGNAAAIGPAPPPAAPAAIAATLDRLLHEAPPGFRDRRLVCLHLGAGTPLKRWPIAAFAGLVRLLRADYAVSIVAIGGADERALVAELQALLPGGAVHSLAGAVTLAELPLLLQGCALFVGNDSGPKHLAGVLGVPTVGVHASNVDATEWGPLGPRAIAVRRRMVCGPCYLAEISDCPRGVTCLRGITPAEIYRACRLLLAFTDDNRSAFSA